MPDQQSGGGGAGGPESHPTVGSNGTTQGDAGGGARDVWPSTAMSASRRYQVRSGSQSAHCCFDATVVDTSRPSMIGDRQYVEDGEPQWQVMCECFSEEDAQRIADALNAREPRQA